MITFCTESPIRVGVSDWLKSHIGRAAVGKRQGGFYEILAYRGTLRWIFLCGCALPQRKSQPRWTSTRQIITRGMKTAAVAGAIEDYTGGYPFLVSHVCQLMDARFGSAKAGAASGSDTTRVVWSRDGVDEAVKQLLSERNTYLSL